MPRLVLALAHLAAAAAAAAVGAAPRALLLRGGVVSYRNGYSPSIRQRGITRRSGSLPGFGAVDDESMSDAERVYVLQQFSQREKRMDFLGRVYTLVALQCILTAAVMSLVRSTPALLYRLYRKAPLVMLASLVPAMWLQLSPRASTTAPLNYLLLALFTALTALGLGAATAPLPSSLLLRAGGATLAAVGSLAVYATRTKRDFTAKHGMLVSGIAALWLMGLLQFFFGGSLLASAQARLRVPPMAQCPSRTHAVMRYPAPDSRPRHGRRTSACSSSAATSFTTRSRSSAAGRRARSGRLSTCSARL